MKILITADTHHSKFIINKNKECIDYVNSLLLNEKPDMFIIAGDLNDSQNLKSGSDEMRELIHFIKETTKTANSIGCEYIILRGTKGHDGTVIKTIYESISEGEYKFRYIDTPELVTFKDKIFLFLPEMYSATYEEFEKEISDVTKNIIVDCIFFHGMMDFAVPKLKQIDSEYGLSRSVVINSRTFKRLFKLCAVGGHVHAQIHENNIIYTDSMINSPGNINPKLGIGKLVLYSDTYDYQTLINPYNTKHIITTFDFIKNPLSSIDNDMRLILDEYDINYVIINAIVDANPQTLNNYSSFVRKYKPKYIKKRLIETTRGSNVIDYKNKQNISPDDIFKLVIEIAEKKYDKKIEQERVIRYLNNKGD